MSEMTTKEMIEVMQAFLDGEKIDRCVCVFDSWLHDENPDWNWSVFRYRVQPKKRVGYLNIYRHGAGHHSGAVRESVADAEHHRGSDCIACIRIEYEEGQFDV